MSVHSLRRADCIAYDVSPVLALLDEALEPLVVYAHQHYPARYSHEALIDLWLKATLDDWGVLTVRDFFPPDHPAEVINYFNYSVFDPPRRALHQHLCIPPEFGGREVLVYRYQGSVWLFYIYLM